MIWQDQKALGSESKHLSTLHHHVSPVYHISQGPYGNIYGHIVTPQLIMQSVALLSIRTRRRQYLWWKWWWYIVKKHHLNHIYECYFRVKEGVHSLFSMI